MTHVIEWFFAGLIVLLGMIGSSDTVESPVVTQPAGVMSPGSLAETAAVTGDLLALLGFVPDTPETREWLVLGDLEAWHQATGITRPMSFAEVSALPEDDYQAWLYEMPLETVPPTAMGLSYIAVEDLREVIGYNYFDVLQHVEAGNPPGQVAVVTVQAPPAQIADALLASGYEATRVEGAVLYSLNDDYAADLNAPLPSLRLGAHNRVALLDAAPDAPTTTVIIAKATALVEASLHAMRGTSIADDPGIAALNQVLAANPAQVPGDLVGVIYLGQLTPFDVSIFLGATPEEAQVLYEEVFAALEAEPVDPWRSAALATHRDGKNIYMSALIAFLPGADASANAASIAARLEAYESIVSERSLSDYWSSYQFMGDEANGVPVAWVTMQLDADAGRVLSWLRLVVQSDMLFLQPAGTP